MVLNVVGRGAIAHIQYSGEDSFEEITTLLATVVSDEDNYEEWVKLVGRVIELEGGVNRNSSPASIEFLRNIFDVFLAKFPLFFGYWKRYADIEFSIGGTEAAEMVYERGVSCIPVSVDLWKDYCQFKMETSHVNEITRALFERGAHFVGLDFQSHPFWDKYIEFEERLGDPENVTRLYRRIFEIPSFQFNRYYEKFRLRINSRPLEELLDESDLTRFTDALRAEFPALADLDFDRQLRGKIDLFYYEVYQTVQAEATKRWTFESNIKLSYFHVQDLADDELENWRKYLTFEEEEGDRRRIAFLYERCLVPTALYEEFWLRYARWMFGQNKGYENTPKDAFINNTEEDTRLIFMRACCVFIPFGLPTVRLHWARFEERLKNLDAARNIHLSIIDALPNNAETYISLINLERRHLGNDAAIKMCQLYLGSAPVDVTCHLLVEQARILWECAGDVEGARSLYNKCYPMFLSSITFWKGMLRFECSQPRTNNGSQNEVKKAYKLMIDDGNMSPKEKSELSDIYMNDLLARGGDEAATEYIDTDWKLHDARNGKLGKLRDARTLSHEKTNTLVDNSQESVDRMDVFPVSAKDAIFPSATAG